MCAHTCWSLRCNSSFGGVLKRLKRPHLKCGRSVSSRRVGSNPTSSAGTIWVQRRTQLRLVPLGKGRIEDTPTDPYGFVFFECSML